MRLAKEYYNGEFNRLALGDFDLISQQWPQLLSVAWTLKTKKSFTCVCYDGRQYHYQFLNLLGWNNNLHPLMVKYARLVP